MARVTFAPESKKNVTNYDYPKLKLVKNERARILVGLEDPEVEYVHTIRKPKIENGVPVMKMEERRGRQVEVNEMDFVSRSICLGDPSILENNGSDPKNCPMCKTAKEHPDWLKAPDARYAVNVIRYKTQPGKFDVQIPFQVDVLVWSFTGRMFNKLVDFATEHGDLRQHDLMLGPCENEMYQKFDIAVGSKAEWLANDETKKLTAQAFQQNRTEDLAVAFGSKKEERFIKMDLEDVALAWGDLSGTQAPAAATGSLSTGLDDLMGSTVAQPTTQTATEWSPTADLGAEGINDILGLPTTATETAAPAASSSDLDALLGTPVVDTTPPAVATPVAEAPAEAPAKSSADPMNFDDLLGGLSK